MRSLRRQGRKLREIPPSGVVHDERLVRITEADVDVKPTRQPPAEHPRVLGGDLPVARTVGDLRGPGRDRMCSRAEQPDPAAERVDHRGAGGGQFGAQSADRQADGGHELDLRRPELGGHPWILHGAEHELDRLDGRERHRVDQDQLLLDPHREQVALGEPALVGRC